jgi:choline dehydrogenase-like flavoprotein
MHYVIGSGPSGVAAASALLDRNVPVTMLDVGTECEPDRIAVVRRMSAQEPEEWSAADRNAIRSPTTVRGSFPLKLAYGSAFPYALDDLKTLGQRGTNCLMSYAKGGLSNVWGAAILPNTARDLEDWPITAGDLTAHYTSVARLMPIASAHDELEPLFPIFAPPEPALRPSRLAATLLARMRSHRAALESAGIVFGQSRLAVRTVDGESGQACRYAGLCLSGCPYFSIWNSAGALDALRKREGFTYQPGVLVERIAVNTERSTVAIQSVLPDGSERRTFEGTRAFLACGPISTARIVIDSLQMYDRTLSLCFQPYFLIPMLARQSGGNVDDEARHTLAQIFLEVIDDRVSTHPVHLQLYTFNEFMDERLRRMTRWLGPLGGFVRSRAAGRLLAIQGYLHSSEADPITITSRPDSIRGRAALTLAAPQQTRTPEILDRVLSGLRRHAGLIGASPITSMVMPGQPGDGNHVGGIFPMRSTPRDLETNCLGELPRLPRVHIVDSSALPSLAATTFTYTTMANAHRIADAAARLS